MMYFCVTCCRNEFVCVESSQVVKVCWAFTCAVLCAAACKSHVSGSSVELCCGAVCWHATFRRAGVLRFESNLKIVI